MSPPQPLAIYIHWPFCKKKCPYCDFNSHVRASIDYARWQAALLRELETQATWASNREVASVFFGGGTPSLMPPEIVAALLDRIRELWPATPSETDENRWEITLEANPTSVEAANFQALRQAGVNRVSLGVQSLREEGLRFLGREHNAHEALEAVQLAADTFPRYSFDLIYARPGQTMGAWEAELREALTYARGHLSLYQLTIEEETPFARLHEKGDFVLPEEEIAAEMYECTEAVLAEAGLHAYEISNYAATGEECRHNLAYWRGEEYLGIGPGAHGRVRGRELGFGDQGINIPWHATATLKSPERWLAQVEREGHGLETVQPLSPHERAEEMVMTGLRLAEGLDEERLMRQTGLGFKEVISSEGLTRAEMEELVTTAASKIEATKRGRLLVNHLIAELLSGSPARKSA